MSNKGNQSTEQQSTDKSGNSSPLANRNKQKQAIGHEIPLASMAKNGVNIHLDLMTGESVVAKMHGFDRFSLTVETDDGELQTYFKHAIVMFTKG